MSRVGTRRNKRRRIKVLSKLNSCEEFSKGKQNREVETDVQFPFLKFKMGDITDIGALMRVAY